MSEGQEIEPVKGQEIVPAKKVEPCLYDWQHGSAGERFMCVTHRHSAADLVGRLRWRGYDTLDELLRLGKLTGQALRDASGTTPAPVVLNVDGACEPINPGGHACGTFIAEVEGREVKRGARYFPPDRQNSNNFAEYEGLVLALEWVVGTTGDIRVFSDSKMLVEQMSGRWGARAGTYIPSYQHALGLVRELRRTRVITFQWIPREQNTKADSLSVEELASRGVKRTIH